MIHTIATTQDGKKYAVAVKDSVFTKAMSEQAIASDRPALNVAAVKEHALRCSVSFRAGKFTRVGQDFIDEVFVDVDCLVREIRNKYNNTVHEALEPNVNIVKGPFMDKIALELDRAICRLIQNKVQRQPTVGCTLGRTR